MKKKVKQASPRYEVKKDGFIKEFLKAHKININFVIVVGLVVVFLFCMIFADNSRGVKVNPETGELASVNPVLQLSFLFLFPVVIFAFLVLVYLISYFAGKN
jgi:hypothetical protein